MPDIAYDVLTVEAVPDYIRSRPALAARIEQITDVREVGDGNLNLVFVVSGKDGTSAPAGLVLKQSLPYVRADPSWPMAPERNHAEARALRVHGSLAADLVPALYDADPDRFVLAVEDLSDHRVWRAALVDGERHDEAAAALGRYVARTAFGTSAFGLASEPQKRLLAATVNPALCQITELLLFTAPYTPGAPGHDPVARGTDLAAAITAYVTDPDVVTAIGAAKWAFMTRAEALIHGDLHTGSVMVRPATAKAEESTRAFDSEFAFYGPVGFDLGVLWANLLLAAARSAALGDTDNLRWRLAQPAAAWNAFTETFRALWPGRVAPATFTEGVLEGFLDQVRRDALAAAAAEAARRVVGPYPVADLETLPRPERAQAGRAVLAACRYLLLDPGAARAPVETLFDRVGDRL
ncbi:S-methyl-5-thioribose kinase [Frankia sp. CNm7]|uniref:S-methyl-5-thioribose kinase n=1 Tax=Frankia nepalensis TaxID=1836974 RepID=A0A937UPX4_9ACTN|nr:S-methyl-5-thioribose kinase [Frankia nepalensis]MBL7501118.1 S-methyl-5-thioribose kinase [Frankia nepalensis]MBL7515072.1 S-methyl-5-thioribose kinase [Frankia nepalensis]MBL7518795.1 S-methyl-5-thioribose kinase [Frankia nepalensis]MBL7631304.1 S-methyl-5-thioribose kinase [Frankia nepalensis]